MPFLTLYPEDKLTDNFLVRDLLLLLKVIAEATQFINQAFYQKSRASLVAENVAVT
jgi:hypothetical protein